MQQDTEDSDFGPLPEVEGQPSTRKDKNATHNVHWKLHKKLSQGTDVRIGWNLILYKHD